MEKYPEFIYQDQGMPSSSSWFWGSKDDMSLLESGLLGKCNGEMEGDDYYYSFQSKLQKFSEPRLLSLVEFFRELYFRRRDLFRKIFPQLQDQFLDVLKKSGMRLWRVKSDKNRTRFATMRRSLSLGSPRSTGVKEVEPQLRNEWIKVRTINSGGSDQQGGSGSQANDSKSSGATN